ncbi:MAG TPA: Crp/Fnr family transcriptional regulator [Fimbriimonas sp.]|nr:Crp/Fnr family transcriptional regulator [Fimbriimonas sp.]
MDQDYSKYLRHCSLFARLDESLLRLLHPGCLWVRLNANETLFHEGAPGGSIYVICQGEIAIERTRFRGDDKEDVVTLRLRRPHEVIGELSLFEGTRTATARATSKTVLLMVDGRYLQEVLRRSNDLAVELLKTVVEKLKESMTQTSDEKMAPIGIRLAKHLLELCDVHGIHNADGSVDLAVMLTQTDLARRIGCSREKINKELKEFGEGVVECSRGRITIRSLKAVKRAASRNY